jgi:hypothetical protein
MWIADLAVAGGVGDRGIRADSQAYAILGWCKATR